MVISRYGFGLRITHYKGVKPMNRSNVRQLSNVYILKDSFRDDKEFQAQVRGRSNLEKMLVILSGKAWIKGHVSVQDQVFRLTPLQKRQFNRDTYCTKGKRSEIIWGLVKTEEGLETTCRCENTACRHFKGCRPDYVPGKQKKKDIILLHDNPELKTKLSKLPDPVLRLQDNDTKVIPVQPNIIIQIDNEQRIPDLNYQTDTQLKTVLSGEGLPDISEEELHGNNQDTIIQAGPEEKLLVLAGPGTGKTYSLIEKLKYMVGSIRSIEADAILLLCYTNAAVKEIKERLKLEVETGKYSDDLAFVDIRTFDSFATLVLMHKGQDMNHMNYDERIEAAIDQIRADPAILENFSHLIVDEVQDLVGPRARLVRTLLENLPEEAGFTLLGDHLQGIYDYQVRNTPEELSAQQLLKWVDTQYDANLKTIRLTINHRQSSTLMPFTVSSRKLLESEQNENVRKFLQQIKSLPSRGKSEKVAIPVGQDNVAILCRSNGEVLKISSALRARHIKHAVRRNNTPLHLPVLFADLLNKWEGIMNQEQFNEFNAGEKLCTSEYGEKMFPCLEAVQNNYLQNSKRSSSNINSIDLIKALSAGTPLPDEIYENDYTAVVLSTIHQAKGREYDSVIMTCTNFDGIAEEELMDEAKVYC